MTMARVLSGAEDLTPSYYYLLNCFTPAPRLHHLHRHQSNTQSSGIRVPTEAKR